MDLDDLLAESLAPGKEKATAEAARERLKRGGQAAADAAADAQRIRDWEAKYEWKDEANVACFVRHRCGCGSDVLQFHCLLLRQSHRHLRFSQRWLAVTAADTKLPNEVAVRVFNSVELCADCALGKGWDLDKAVDWPTDARK